MLVALSLIKSGVSNPTPDIAVGDARAVQEARCEAILDTGSRPVKCSISMKKPPLPPTWGTYFDSARIRHPEPKFRC